MCLYDVSIYMCVCVCVWICMCMYDVCISESTVVLSM